MKVKHKLLNDFQFISPDKKIFILKAGTILEEYNHKVKNEVIPIDRDIVDNNPEFFEVVDWKTELLSFMRVNKMPQPAQLGKKLIPFIEDMILSSFANQAAPDAQTTQELITKETELFKREAEVEKRSILTEQKEEELEAREVRVAKRESNLKEDITSLEKREETVKQKSKSLIEKEFDLEGRDRKLDEKERNAELNSMKSHEEIDAKYAEIQARLTEESDSITRREGELDERARAVDEKSLEIEGRISQLERLAEELDARAAELDQHRNELTTLDSEIKQWEALHWKFKRFTVPPSAIPESMNPDINFYK
jgi:uncharacterized protein (DUF3084 family)